MNKSMFSIIALIISSHTYMYTNNLQPSAVSYELNGGRFGDNIRSFTQAYWEAYKHNIPLLYVPFPGSEQLVLHTQFQELTPRIMARYQGIRTIQENQQLLAPHREGVLYITTYFCRTDIDWKNLDFLEKIKYLFSPKGHIDLPNGIKHAIALHIRRGGGFFVDTDQCIRSEGTHFPDITYFARSLDYLLTQIEGSYVVYIFTDDPNPAHIAEQLLHTIRSQTAQRISVQYRERDNFHDRHVIEDFVATQHARYLIRPSSNFSDYAQLFGDHECVVIPGRFRAGNPYGIIESAVFVYKNRPAEIIMLRS